MQFKAKKLLVILELNETLLYLHNSKSKYVNFGLRSQQIKYDDHFDNYDVLYRKGRGQMFQYLFGIQRNNIDVAVWTNLDHQTASITSQHFFGRFFRQLLFVLPTNRTLYLKNSSENTQQSPIQIPKQLNNIYSRFSGYNSTNTLVFSSVPNPVEEHQMNDIVIPAFNPSKMNYQTDHWCATMTKYVKGMKVGMNTKLTEDIRVYAASKPISKLGERYGNRLLKDPEFS